MGEQENLRVIERFWRAFDRLDFEAAAELLHTEYLQVWPQSGERIRGRANFVAINKRYPQQWRVSVLRLLASGDQVVSEVKFEDRDELVFAISFFEFRDGKILKETDYWPEPYDPPVWRAEWVE